MKYRIFNDISFRLCGFFPQKTGQYPMPVTGIDCGLSVDWLLKFMAPSACFRKQGVSFFATPQFTPTASPTQTTPHLPHAKRSSTSPVPSWGYADTPVR